MNFKKYYREIIIGLLLVLSLWLGSNQTVKIIGNTDTICHSDTTLIYKTIQSIEIKDKVAYKWLKIADTTYIRDTFIDIRNDTAFQLVEIPFNEYKDSIFYARTLGWLDSISINPIYKTVFKTDFKKDRMTIFAQASLGKDIIAPSINISFDKVQLGAGYNLNNSGLILNFGYRLK